MPCGRRLLEEARNVSDTKDATTAAAAPIDGPAAVSKASPLWASAIFAFQQCGLNRTAGSAAQRS
jgi:hypothetical protein